MEEKGGVEEIAWVSGLPMGEGGGGTISLLHLSPFLASIFTLFPRNAWYSGYRGNLFKKWGGGGVGAFISPIRE